jgi:hypothetical protein
MAQVVRVLDQEIPLQHHRLKVVTAVIPVQPTVVVLIVAEAAVERALLAEMETAQLVRVETAAQVQPHP